MPIKPSPIRYKCPKCGWSKVFAPKSDALVEMPPKVCEKCGGTDLESSPVSALGEIINLVSSMFSRK